MDRKRIYIAHGAIRNSGDFLIFNRGWAIIQSFLKSDDIDLIPVKRWEPITGSCDALIILGGPIITRKIHSQSANLKNYIERNKPPVICLGVGISGEDFSGSEPYFKDQESVDFWTAVYNSSRLFSVRDIITQQVLRENNIQAILTGCPALYDTDYIYPDSETQGVIRGKRHNLTITIPNIKLSSISKVSRTLFFLWYLKIKKGPKGNSPHQQIVFQHGYQSLGNNAIEKVAWLLGFDTIDGSGRSLNEIDEVIDSDVHIGTRLHMNIYFLSRDRLSYLLNIDNRTNAFLKTIHTPSEIFTFGGIKRLVDEFYEDLITDISTEKIRCVRGQVNGLYPEMRDYLMQVRNFISSI